MKASAVMCFAQHLGRSGSACVLANGEQLYSKILVMHNSRHISGVILVSISSHSIENFQGPTSQQCCSEGNCELSAWALASSVCHLIQPFILTPASSPRFFPAEAIQLRISKLLLFKF